MNVKETYRATAVGVNSTTRFTAEAVGGFLALTTGTLSISDNAGNAIVAAVPVTAGLYTPMPFFVSYNGGSITTAGGASGYLATA